MAVGALIRINLLRDRYDLADRAFYRPWTVRAGRGYVKLGPVSLVWYRWFDNRWRLGVIVLNQREHIVWGGPLA